MNSIMDPSYGVAWGPESQGRLSPTIWRKRPLKMLWSSLRRRKETLWTGTVSFRRSESEETVAVLSPEPSRLTLGITSANTQDFVLRFSSLTSRELLALVSGLLSS